MLTIGIYAGELFFPPERMHFWDENNLETGGIGGSEIWAIELADQLSKMNNKVVVICDCEKSHISTKGVQYVSLADLLGGHSYYFQGIPKFDFVILSRRTDIPYDLIPTNTFFLMAHDPRILDAESYEDLHMEHIHSIAYQSEWQKQMLINRYPGLTEDKFFKTSQALDPNLYADVDLHTKKNKMVWSSHKVRGVKFFIERIMPIIRKYVPDFELDVTGYIEDTTDDYFNAPGVNIKGCVEKSELIRLQKESKIWVYPNWGKFDNGWVIDETFCITAIENAFAKNAIFCADKTCFSTTLEGYNGFIGTGLFPEGEFILPEEKWDEFAIQLASAAVCALTNDNARRAFGECANSICQKYTWENVANSFLSRYKAIYPDVIPTINNSIATVLMTAVLRTSTLPRMLENIKQIYFYNPSASITWLLCIDQYNSDCNVDEIVRLCTEYHNENNLFGWYLTYSGNPSQKNFGGDMFNEPLKELKDAYFPNTDDLWVYILDDDNLMTEIFISTLFYAENVASLNNKDVIFYNIKYDNGICAPESGVYFPQSSFGTDLWAYYHTIDPSQLVIKYSFLNEIGFYQPTGKYDWMLFLTLMSQKDRILFPENFMTCGALNRYQVLYNGRPTEATKKKIIQMAKSSIPKIATLDISTLYEGKTIALTNEQLQQIINIL